MHFVGNTNLALELNHQSERLEHDIPVYSKYPGPKFQGFE